MEYYIFSFILPFAGRKTLGEGRGGLHASVMKFMIAGENNTLVSLNKIL
jgi:hypothetical protein